MTGGFQAFNDAGTLQFSTDTSNFYFVGKGSFNTTFQGNGLPPSGVGTSDSSRAIYTGSVEAAATFDLVVFNAPGAYVIPNNGVLPPGTQVGTTAQGQPIYTTDTLKTVKTSTNVATTVNYWLFRSMSALTPTAIGSGQAGLEIYGADGSVAYTSFQRPLPVVQGVTINASNTNTNTNSANSTVTTVAVPSGTHAFTVFGNTDCREPIANTYGASNSASFGVIDNGTSIGYKKVYGRGKLDLYQAGSLLVLNVAGY